MKTTELSTNNMQAQKEQMEKLLKKKTAPKLPNIGDLVEGSVINIGTNSIYLNLGSLGTGVILGPEIYDGLGTVQTLKINDKISATVLDLENEDGYIELSLRSAGNKKSWENLYEKFKTHETIQAKIINANNGGLIADISGITAFLPVSQLSMKHYPRVDKENHNQILQQLKSYIDKKFNVKIIDIDQDQDKLIVSEKEAERKQNETLMSKLKLGQTVQGKVSGIAQFGIFIKFQVPKTKKYLEGLVHISELAWQRIEDPKKIIKKNDKVKAKIISIKNDRIALSIRQLKKDPWKGIEKKYKIGTKIKGKVTKIDHYGAFVQLDKKIQGLAHISQFGDKIPLQEDKEYSFKIISLEPDKHRLQLEYIK